MKYGAAPSGYTVNIGDSRSNDGWGGDAASQSNDAEMLVHGTTMWVYGNDPTPAAVRNILNVYNAVAQGSVLLLDVTNNYLGWTAGELRSDHLYALAGQADTEGPVNYDIYAGFNRSIYQAGRTGTGVTRVTVTLEPPSGSGGGGGGGNEHEPVMEQQP